MATHTYRDKQGRFAKKPASKARKPRTPKATPAVVVASNLRTLNFFILDESSSMHGKESGVREGFNTILQQAEESVSRTGIKNVNFLQRFSSRGRHEWIENVQPLGLYYRVMGGGTALYDALELAIYHADKESVQTDKVVVTVFTDGEENDSRISRDAISRLVVDRKSKGWVINLIGAGHHDFIKRMANDMGIDASNTLAYANTVAGTQGAMQKMSASLTSYRGNVAKGIDTNVGFFADI